MTPYPPPPNCAVAEDFGSQVAVRLNVTLSLTDQVAQRLLAISVTAVELYLIAGNERRKVLRQDPAFLGR